MFPSWVIALKQKSAFLPILPSLLQQFTYMHLKVLITLFQKMIWFIDVWATFHEILAIQIPKRCWLSRNLTEFLKTVSHGTINNKNFWECFCREISALTVCNIQFWILKYSKFIFMWSPLWSIQVCIIPRFWVKSYRFSQLIILF